MKANIQNVAAIILGFQMMNASAALADEEKVPESVTQDVVEAEKKSPEQEKREEGEASGNVEDCEQSNDSGDAEDGVDQKDLDACNELIK